MLAFLSIMGAYLKRNRKQLLREKRVDRENTFISKMCVSIPKVQVKPISLRYYRVLMIKMKISYMAWEMKTDIAGLFFNAISLTLEQE